jgi:hypothetical protein
MLIGLKQNLSGLKIRLSLGGDTFHKMADNAGQGLISTGNRKCSSHSKINATPCGDCVEKHRAFFYPCPEDRSRHVKFRWMNVVCAIQLPCSGR